VIPKAAIKLHCAERPEGSHHAPQTFIAARVCLKAGKAAPPESIGNGKIEKSWNLGCV
jgi:hypothetical protein